jgi:putative heme-binding domain-containing protein
MIAFETLSRLEGVDLEAKPDLKAAVYKILTRTHGTAQFVQIVKQFHLKDQDDGLMEVAMKNSSSDTGVEATRLVLSHQNTALLQKNLQSRDVSIATKTAEALGNAGEKKAVPLLLPIVTDSQRDVAVRKQAVRALAQTADGAHEILNLAREQKLADDLKFVASSELNAARWQKVKTEAAQLLPLPPSQNAQPLPPVAELLKMKGAPAAGEKVFYREAPGCFKCHQIKGNGAQIGPDLSEIGTKLGKDAMVEAILDPSSGISLGYETYTLELKSGDEAYGLLASDSADEIAIKDLKGIVTHYKKSDVKDRRQLKTSIMPTGLQAAMTTQEFVDLLEYLASLKKAGN